MKVINLEETTSAVNHYMAQLRDVDYQKNRTLFRNNLRRIGNVMAYEISRTLTYTEKVIQTPLAKRTMQLTDEHLVVGTVLRAGLAFHEGFLEVFDQADAAFVAAYRTEDVKENIQFRLDYLAAPDLNGSTFLMVDPMLATGGSLSLAYQAFSKAGVPAKLHICCAISSQEGIDRLQKEFPSDDVTLWTAAIDPILNENAYIVPGLGDAGDLSFGEKLPMK